MTINPKYLNADGTIKNIGEHFSNSKPNTTANLEDARPHWFRSDGTLKSTAEIRDDEARDKHAKDLVAAELRARTHRELTEDERLIKSLTKLIDDRTREATYLSDPAARMRAKEYVDRLKDQRAGVEAKIAEEKRIERFEKSEHYARVKEHSEAFRRTPPKGSDPQAVALALAIADSRDFQDPAEWSRAYFGEVAKVEEAAYAAVVEAREQSRNELAAKQLETASLTTEVQATQQRIEQAKGLASE
jgi:hypothetical protein